MPLAWNVVAGGAFAGVLVRVPVAAERAFGGITGIKGGMMDKRGPLAGACGDGVSGRVLAGAHSRKRFRTPGLRSTPGGDGNKGVGGD